MSTHSSNLYHTSGILLPKDACIVIVRTEWNAETIDRLEKACIKVLEENSVSYKISTRNELNSVIQILIILQKEGIIRSFTYIKNPTQIIIYLKYNELGNNVIKSIFRVSKPSRPVYLKTKTF